MRRDLILEPADVLRKRCKEVEEWNEEFFTKLLIDMKDTMIANNGGGLAANQIGLPLRIILVSLRVPRIKELVFMANPVITKKSKRIITTEEGCLSCPETTVKVPRHFQIKVEGVDPRRGKRLMFNLTGASAGVIQHEIDHLEGILIIDY